MDDFISTEQIDNNFFEECKCKLDSYMSKEELLSIINNIDFMKVKFANLELITGCITDNKTKEFKILSKNITID